MNARPMPLGRRATLFGVAVVLGLLAAAVPAVASATVTLRPFAPGSGGPAPLATSLEAFWAQPPDMNGSKISSEVTGFPLSLESMVAVDFETDTDAALTRVVWWGGYYNNWNQGGPDVTNFYVYIYDDAAGVPGNEIDFYYATPTSTEVGNDGLGLPVYRYEAPIRTEVQASTRYWLVVQADDNGYPPQWGWLQSTELEDNQAKFQSEYFEHPDWVDASAIADEPWDGAVEIHINTPTIQACCFPNGSCEMLLPAECAELQGTDQGQDTVCIPNPCPQPEIVACCTWFGCIMLSEPDCTESEGTSQGPDSVCEPDPCPPTQACCLEFGICFQVTVEGCTESQGTPQGEGTDCDPNPCSVTGEACCLFGFCFVMEPAACTDSGGEPQGEGTDCDPSPCGEAEQACCVGETCTMVVPSACTGTPQGIGSTCDPNPCVPVAEGCCFADVHCEMLTPEACEAAGGARAGFGTTCEADPCPYPVPTESKSWGAIKGIFR